MQLTHQYDVYESSSRAYLGTVWAPDDSSALAAARRWFSLYEVFLRRWKDG